jgi:putative FmdB family regulatory protein
VVIYEYRCRSCGRFEVAQPMGAAPGSCPCVQCGEPSPRAYSAPHTNRTSAPLAAALTRAEKSRDEPEIVTELPARRGKPRPRIDDPRLKQLPRW